MDPMNDTHEALLAVGDEGGPEAVALVATLMNQNARHLEATFESLFESEKAAHDRTKARLEKLQAHLEAIESRIYGLLAPPVFTHEELDYASP